MKPPTFFLTIGLALIALATACNEGPQPPLAVQAALPPAPDSLVREVAGVLGVAPEPTPTPRPKKCPDSETATKQPVLNQDPKGSGVYAFDPNELTFSVGECVEFTVTAETESHTFTVDDLEIDESLGPGQTITFAFTFEQAGEFGLICIPHLGNDMTGTITVR